MILIVKHIYIEGPGTIESFFSNIGYKFLTVNLADGDKLPAAFKDIEAVIILGGPMNVYEEEKYRFLIEEDDFLKEAVKKDIPVLGICLGAQLLAKACGAKVKKAPLKEIGWYKINLTKEGRADELFKGLPQGLEVFQWHEDTFDIPEKGAALAESGSCRNQAFRIGKNAYGLQFHIEVIIDIIKSWVEAYIRDEKASSDAKNMLSYARKTEKVFRQQADLIYLNFSQILKNT